jgi:hypothetical protein
MTTEYLQQQLARWQQLLLICTGASGVLLATALTDTSYGSPSTAGWFAIWLILQLGVTPAGFMLVSSKGWQTLPMSTRLNTAFGYFTVAWITLAALGFRVGSTFLGLLLFASGAALLVSYLWTHRGRSNSPEEMFP